MLNLYKYYLIILTLIFPSVSFSAIEILISFDKAEYLEGEPILFNFSIFNNSDKLDSVNYEMLELFNIKVFDSENNECTYVCGTGDRIGNLFVKIEPYKSAGHSINLIACFVNEFFPPCVSSSPGYLRHSIYSIQYKYYNKFISNEIKVSILEPANNEKVVFEKLKSAYRINDVRYTDFDSLYIKQKIFYQIALNFPESIYWNESVYKYNLISSILNLSYTDITLNKDYINKYPESTHNLIILKNLCKSVYYYDGGQAEVTKYLENLIKNNPETYISSIAKNMLKEKTYLNN